MRAGFGQCIPYHCIELQKSECESFFLRFAQRRSNAPHRCTINIGATKDAANAGVCILQVRRSVAIERQHAVPVEDVVLNAIGGKVGIFHCTDANHASNVCPFICRQRWVLFFHCTRCSLYCFFQQCRQLYRFTTAALQHFFIGAQHIAERHVLHFYIGRQPTSFLCSSFYHL